MSRIGKLPVNLPAGVTVEVLPGNVVKVKGPLGELSQKVDVDINVAVEGTEVKLTRPTDQPRTVHFTVSIVRSSTTWL